MSDVYDELVSLRKMLQEKDQWIAVLEEKLRALKRDAQLIDAICPHCGVTHVPNCLGPKDNGTKW